MNNETISKKASWLKQELEHDLTPSQHFNEPATASASVKVKLSHCHELIAAAFGYNSKAAMNADVHNSSILNDHEFYIERWRETVYGRPSGEQKIIERIQSLRDTPLHTAHAHSVVSLVKCALAPQCQDCYEKDPRGRFVFNGYGDNPIDFVCSACAQDEQNYDTCRFCGDEYLYPASIINSSGECPEHQGESHMDDEELEDLESYIENINKDSF